MQPDPSSAAAVAAVPKRIGLIVVATARYTRFVPDLLASVRRHFLRDAAVTVFVCTDRPDEIPADAVPLPVEHRPWPYATLLRYHHVTRHAARLAECDYLFQCDADMRFVADAGSEVLPGGGRDLVGVEHPGFCWRPSRWTRLLRRAGFHVRRGRGPRGSYETDPRSLACVGPKEGTVYFAGGFTGGTASAYLRMARTLAERIDRDLERGVIAVWHDESHLNRYFIDHPPQMLDPRYCYPESWDLPFVKILVALDKDHAAMRAE
jgi:histo-blood group ABO system transferase